MIATPRHLLRTYVALTALSTLASSFVWGINTLFLLDAGLTVTEAFLANAFFTLGEVLFEIPTGVAADAFGRRTSYLLGAATLLGATLLYWVAWRVHGPFWGFAVTSVLLGLGFTFFSGATEAWLVDGLKATGYEGTLDAAFARGQIATGAGMLAGTTAGGALAQATSLGAPYLVRAAVLGVTFVVALAFMHDVGFAPARRTSVASELRRVLAASLDDGLRNPPVRWTMLAGLFGSGVPIYGFYAMQPYLLELYGKSDYAVAGLAAALVAASQIAGALLVRAARRVFRRRTSALAFATVASAAAMLAMGLVPRLPVVVAALAAWALLFAAAVPVRQAFLNGLVRSERRATVLSSDNLLGSLGGAIAQPALGRVAELSGWAASYVASAGVALLALPFVLLARRERAPSDPLPPAGRPTPTAR